MILGIITCAVALVLSFRIYDVEERMPKSAPVAVSRSARKLAAGVAHGLSRGSARREERALKFVLPRPVRNFALLTVFYGLVYGMIMIAQPDGKLFIQYQLDTKFDVDTVATIMGMVLFGSRVMRLLAILIYPKVHAKVRGRMTVLIPVMLLMAFGLMLLGNALEMEFYLKIVVMGIGFGILPAMRDPLRVYAQNFLLQNFQKKYQKDALMYLATARQLGAFIFGSVASAILLNFSLEYVYLLFAVLILPLVCMGIMLKNMGKKCRV